MLFFTFANKKIRQLKKIYQFTLKSYLGPFVMTFFIALFILLMQFLWKYIDDLVGKGLEWDIIAQLLFYASLTFIPMALPLAILLSSLMTFGNLGEHYELVAMKASGISVWVIMRPLIILSICISGVAFYFSNNMLPIANLKFQTILFDVRQQKLAFDIKEGVFYNGIENYIIRIAEKDKDGKTIYNVQIYDHSDRMGNIKVTTAKSGIMELSPDQKNIIFTLFDGYSYTEIVNTNNYRVNFPFERTKFNQQRIKFDLSEFGLNRSQDDMFKSHYTMLNINQLNYYIDSLNLHYDKKETVFNTNFNKRFQNFSTIDTTRAKQLGKHTAKISQKPQDVPVATIDTSTILTWPLIENFNKNDKASIIDYALNSVKNSKENASWNHKDLYKQQENIRKHQIVWHKKFTLSIACLILFFIGAPMGAIIRKGGLGFPVVISVFFFVIYHITSIMGEKAAKVGDIDLSLGVWMSSLVLFPIGLFLTFKATTDAPLLDGESWVKTFKKLFLKFKKVDTPKV